MAIFNTVYGGEWKWKPWANTIAYYPLTATSTVNDFSGHNNTLTNYNSAQFGDYNWVSCYLKTSWNYLQWTVANIPTWNSNRTVSVWLVNDGNTGWTVVWWWNWWWATQFSLFFNGNYPYFSSNGTGDIQLDATLTTGIWYNLILTYDGTATKMYQNWAFMKSSNMSLNTWWTQLSIWSIYSSSTGYKWKISNLIIENKVRTAQEIADYYNLTKSNYWL